MRKALIATAALMAAGIHVAVAQTRTVSGTVVDENNEPYIGATVLIKGTTSGTQTDADGKFSLEAPADATLIVRAVGYTDQEVAASGNLSNIRLSSTVRSLNETVITALNIPREKKSLGYSSQSVSGEDLSRAREANVINSLAGKVAGATVSGNSNMGGSSRIVLRGARSLTGNNQALIVIDGIPLDNSNYNNSNQVQGANGYDYGNTGMDINPDDIEKIDILKGAVASALYGERGSNGAIMITTKKGARRKAGDGRGPVGIEFNMSAQWNTPYVFPNYQNRYGGGAGPNFDKSQIDTTQDIINYSFDGSWGPEMKGQQVRQWYNNFPGDSARYLKTDAFVAHPDNVKDFFQTGQLLTTSVAASGGTESSTYRIGYTNLDQTATMVNGKMKRNTFTGNFTTNFSERLSGRLNATYVNQDVKGRPEVGHSTIMSMFNQWFQRSLDMNELKNYMNPDGTQRSWNMSAEDDPAPLYWDNPYWTRYKDYQTDQRDRILGSIGLSYRLWKNTSINVNVYNDNYTDTRQERVSEGGVNQSGYSETVRRFNEVNYEATLTTNRYLSKDLSMDALLGVNQRRGRYNANSAATSGGLIIPDFYNIENSKAAATVSDYRESRRVNSAFGRMSLGYKGMFYLDGTARVDASSTLATPTSVANAAYLYPSISASWVFSENVKSRKILPYGKVRFGVTETSAGTEPYRTMITLQQIAGGNFGTSPMYTVPNALNNVDLRPERTNTKEVGLDLGLFRNRLTVEATYYHAVTRDLIFAVPVSRTSGYSSRITNAGSMRNTGVELNVAVTPVKTQNVTVTVGGNWAKNRNKVLELNPGVENIRLGGIFGASVEARIGLPYGQIVGYDYVYDDQGNKLVSPDGFYAKTATVVPLGSYMPDWRGGVYTDINLWGFNVYALIDGSKGGKIYSLTNAFGKGSGMFEETAQGDMRENGIVNPGKSATQDANGKWVSTGADNTVVIDAIEHFNTDGSQLLHAANLFDASFVKLREIRVGYQLPAKWFERSRIQGAGISLVGRNLAILQKNIAHIDPDAALSSGNIQGLEGGQLPTERSVGINLNVKF